MSAQLIHADDASRINDNRGFLKREPPRFLLTLHRRRFRRQR
jgi:hypothetical protein